MKRLIYLLACLLMLSLSTGCAEDFVDVDVSGDGADENPFLADYANTGKEDTAYVNPDGIEVEVDIEGDVTAPSYRIFDAPAELGQYAVTYLRKRGQFYLESLAEDATSDQRVEWQVDGEWLTAAEARRLPTDQLRHFRLRGVNAVFLHSAADRVSDGDRFTATVPLNPYSAYSDGGAACTDPDDHLGLSASIYWYLWNPDKDGCEIETQQLQITVARLLPPQRTTYPEYDRLIADEKITAVVLFGRIGDPPLTDSDAGVRNMNRMAQWLTQADFAEIADPPVGRRFSKTVAGIEVVVDLYSPYDFAGLSDFAHFANFERAIREHEIVAYDGHSMLGASDFWSRPEYPDFYQIYLYGGCLGYEYYVRPILAGKNGWDNVDIVSSVIEVWASANYYFAPFLAKVMWALENNYNATWTDLIQVIRNRVGDSTFGVSGARDNCFSPTGSLCGGETPGNRIRFDSGTGADIPDNSPEGVQLTIEVPENLNPSAIALELNVTHTWVGDLTISLEHGDRSAVIWNKSGGSNDDIHQTFTLTDFAGVDTSGPWTLSVVDTANYDTGRVDSWALVFTVE